MKLYELISNDIKEMILQKELKQGAKLPAINSLCKKYNCSKSSVIKAYDTLCNSHIVYSQPQSGFYVADNLMRLSEAQTDYYDLSTGNSFVKNIPAKDIQHCLNSAVEIYSNASLTMDISGLASLRKFLVHQLIQSDIYCKDENLILSQGILQVLVLLSKMDFPNGNNTILIEEPSYNH